MAARSSLAYLITLLRQRINDADSDVWTDNELEKTLDLNRRIIRRKKLDASVDRLEFTIKFQLLEGTNAYSTEAGAAWDDDRTIIKLWNSSASGATAITPDAWNLVDGVMRFTSEQTEIVYMDAISYRIHGAIADSMEQIIMDPQKAKSWTRGGVTYTFQDLEKIVNHHRGLDGHTSPTVVRRYRKG